MYFRKARMRFSESTLSNRFTEQMKTLHEKKVNVLEFLSAENLDHDMERSTFLKGVIHTFDAVGRHVIVDLDKYFYFTSKLDRYRGFYKNGTRLPIPPYPPSELPFDYAAFLQHLQDAEADIGSFDYYKTTALPSFKLLHKHLHCLVRNSTSVPKFMADREPARGTPGAVIYKYLLKSIDPTKATEEVTCELVFAHVATGRYGTLVWNPREPSERPRDLSHAKATAFVNLLPKLDVAEIPEDSMRCSYCWSYFDEVGEGLDNRPVRLPCHSKHIVGRDYLIELLASTNLCPLCKRDVFAIHFENH